MSSLIAILAIPIAAIAAIAAILIGGMRAKWPPVVDAVRRLNIRVFNPRQMHSAGQPGAFAGILRHTGRTSGKEYETPLGIEPTGDGFLIGMVYGPRTQWARNVLAAGRASVVVEGRTYEVDRPEIVPVAEVMADLKPSDQRLFGLFGVEGCLRLRKVAETDD